MYRDGALLMYCKRRGFTIVELMVSITLGLLITAAAVQLFFSGQLGYIMQKGMADVQDNGTFGLRFVTYELRKSNYGQMDKINDRLKNGGIVITSAQAPLLPTVSALNHSNNTIPLNLPRTIVSSAQIPVSKSGLVTNARAADSASGLQTSIGLGNDQLVMQFYADRNGIDCEGNSYTAGRFIVQRFFLREDIKTSLDPHSALVLACEAGSYVSDESTTILRNVKSPSVFGGTVGQILMYRVDHFHYLLGISNESNTANKRYIAIEDYKKINEFPRPRINSIQIGVLVRSTESIGQSNLVSDEQEFQVLDQVVQLKKAKGTNSKYLRQVVSQTIALRNGLTVTDAAEGL